ncbi:DUF58 domain-containing protein [Nocardioidaceae bacterium]|nr:DUF58 domain-containing protein [Nocardioidaceae bacterium]
MALTGRVAVLLLLGAVPVLLRPELSTAWLWALVVVAAVGLDLALAPSTRLLELGRSAPTRVRQHEESQTQLHLRHTGRRRARVLLRDAWQPSAGTIGERHRVVLAAQESATLVTRLVPTRRGVRRADRVTIRTHGPLGLAARQRAREVAGSVRVVPPFWSRRLLPSRLARLRELDGRTAVQVRGAGTEFDSLREYVRGDDTRSIDWRASARSRTTVVRTWQPERDRRVVLVLDTARTSAGRVAGVPRLDAAMEAALLLTALASRAGDRVDLVAGDTEVRRRVRGATGSRRTVVREVEDALADLEPRLVEADWDRLAAGVSTLGRDRALVVLLTPLEPEAVLSGLLPRLPQLTARHQVVLASVRDPELEEVARRREDAQAVYAAAAAERDLARRREVARLLGSLGVEVLDVDADALPAALVDHYLALKAAGRL